MKTADERLIVAKNIAPHSGIIWGFLVWMTLLNLFQGPHEFLPPHYLSLDWCSLCCWSFIVIYEWSTASTHPVIITIIYKAGLLLFTYVPSEFQVHWVPTSDGPCWAIGRTSKLILSRRAVFSLGLYLKTDPPLVRTTVLPGPHY